MSRFSAVLLAFLLVLGAWQPAHAVNPDEVLDDPALEERARALSLDLRCMVCQNQSIDDSNAPLARDLRLLVRERLVAGDTDRQVMDYVVQRYGEYVLLNPRLAGHTLLLWFTAPALFLLGGGLLLAGAMRRRREAAPSVQPLSFEERAKLHSILREKDDG